MVQDVRKIIFTPNELAAAFAAYRRVTPDFLPSGEILGCVPVDNGTIVLTLALPEGSEPPQAHFSFKGVDMLKPIIRFCIENNIMLPRNGRKSITTTNGCVALSVVLDMEIDIGHGLSLSPEQLKPADPSFIERQLAEART